MRAPPALGEGDASGTEYRCGWSPFVVGDTSTVGGDVERCKRDAELVSLVLVRIREHLYTYYMSMDSDPDNVDDEKVREVVQRLEAAGGRCGLYLESADFAVEEGQDGPARPTLVMASFRVGDLAFTDRVLNPSAEEDNKVVREMEVGADLDEVKEIRRRAAEGVGPLAELKEDDDGAGG
jgi:hypothetical protein